MKKDVLFAIIGILAIAAICLGLTQAVALTPPGPSPVIAGTAEATGQRPVVGKVIMRVNGQPVTQREFELFMSSLPEQMQPYLATPGGKKQVAEQLARLIVLQQEAQKLGADRDPEVQARMNLGEANLVAQWAAEKIAGKPSDAQLRAEYNKHLKDYSSFDLSHILVAYQGSEMQPRNGQPLAPQQAMQKAQEIEKQLRAGANFGQVAAAISDDTASAARDGQLGNVNPSQLPPDLAQAVAALKPGEISQPIQSRFGIHIFKKGKETSQPFEQVKPALERQAQQTSITAAIDRLQKTAKVDMDPGYFNAGPTGPSQIPVQPGQPRPPQG